MTTDLLAPPTDLPELAQGLGNYIGGRWESDEAESFAAINPATGGELVRLPLSTRETARRAVAYAKAAQPAWARRSTWDRATLCASIGDAIAVATDDLAHILSMEQGKTLAEATAEVTATAHGFHMSAELVRYMTGEVQTGQTPDRLFLTQRHPRGVYAVITPWNYPVMIPGEYLAPAIATGNTVVWVPAQTTSLVAAALMRVIASVGLPEGLINLVLGQGAVVGDEIVGHEDVQGIGFTGSTRTGKSVAERGAGKPMLLELGGNGPVIVRRDADLDLAAQAAALGAFMNSGQICAATGRVLADSAIAGELAEKIAEIARSHQPGDPLHQGTTMGPLNNAAVVRKTREHVDEAIAAGARCLAGGHLLPDLGSDFFYAPTVLADVTPNMRVAREETFGPVVPIIALDGDDELLRVANDTDYGLTMSIFSRDMERALAMSTELSAGIININAHTVTWETHMPLGGASGTNSGIGRLGGRHTIEAMTEMRMVTIPAPKFAG
ncbi:aldehyde dehydrogenase family protein [Sphingobium xenophagum]|uniref:Alpha-ketoglutaric semialdehyde dehydrogenase n=1 Tax=Sphingobium xenophagum TaxID=121428 RepID=A0A401J986_SPHXE|nr:aldehyde dehydrogenase family protein [Sphingobium xenophagum]GBH33144.1 alpha-ketoglutaric semialdehyde dehydrogenase [Sphingobium xenophagum]